MGTLTCEPWPNSSWLNCGGEAGRQFAERDADHHAQENPDGQVTLEERQALRIYDLRIYDLRFQT